MGTSRILLVDDDYALALAWRKVLVSAGYEAHVTITSAMARKAIAMARERAIVIHVVLLDLRLEEGGTTVDGRTLLPDLRTLTPVPRVALVSGHLDARAAMETEWPCRGRLAPDDLVGEADARTAQADATAMLAVARDVLTIVFGP